MEAFSKFLESLPPLLQLVFGGIAAVGVFWAVSSFADWREQKQKKK